ncbi:MAG: hypothetical protein DRP73_02930 [Candidatus Omnitrophota bacterium]|nr:MAG: hypothetical protein DRP73_02930 [Candidatus Omnitrophota bacterium]
MFKKRLYFCHPELEISFQFLLEISNILLKFCLFFFSIFFNIFLNLREYLLCLFNSLLFYPLGLLFCFLYLFSCFYFPF